MSPLCIPKLMSFLGVRGPFCVPSQLVWSSPCPLTVRLVLPVSPHSSSGPPRVPSQLVWSSPPHSLFGPPRVPSLLVWSSPCPLTPCFVLPVSPHSSFGPPSQLVWSSPCPLNLVMSSFPGPQRLQRPLPHVLRINFVSSSVSSNLV